MDELVKFLRGFRYPFGTEKELQDAVETAVSGSWGVVREYGRGADRIDFAVLTGIGVVALECKVDGGPSDVLRQLLRYASRDDIAGVVLLTSRHTHRWGETTLCGKPFEVVWVGGVI